MLTFRFLLGSACLGLMVLALRVRIERRAVKDGLWLGLLLTAIFWLQAGGLVTTTTTKSGFITGLYVLFTPAASVLMGHRLKLAHGLGALVATAGLFLLVHRPGEPSGGWNLGDSLTLVCAVGCGFHIALTGIFSRRSNGWVLAFVQVATIALVSLAVDLPPPGRPWVPRRPRGARVPGHLDLPALPGRPGHLPGLLPHVHPPGPPGQYRSRHPLLPGAGVHGPAGRVRAGCPGSGSTWRRRRSPAAASSWAPWSSRRPGRGGWPVSGIPTRKRMAEG